MPIDAILFGGRRKTTIPLVTEARDWVHGTFMGATLSSETTAAATGQVGVVRRDPMAMLPFIGYHAGDYFNHWIEVGKDNDASKLPKIFYVNWFRRDDDGDFVWPGFGENSRVLKWVVERIEGQAAAVETPIGHVPAPGALDTDGLDMTPEQIEAALRVDPEEWKAELPQIQEWFEKFGDKLPAVLWTELDGLRRASASSPNRYRETRIGTSVPGLAAYGVCHDPNRGQRKGMWVPHYGPEDRAVFEARATELYDDIVGSGGIKADDPRITSDSESTEAFDLLVRLNLLTLDTTDNVWHPVDPATAQAQVVTPLGAAGCGAAQRVRRVGTGVLGAGTDLASLLPRPARALHRDQRRRGHLGVPGLCGRRRRGGAADRPAPGRAQQRPPQGHPGRRRPPRHAALERGVKMRTLYQHSARRSAGTHKYVAAVTGRGAEVRTLDEFFNRIIVIDRRIA